jgi:Tfp pilus assembly protein PilX
MKHRAKHARGMALLAGLVLMMAVSLLAVTAAGGMTLQQHQAANFADRQMAFSRADRARSWAVAWLFSRPREQREAACSTNCFLPPAIHAGNQLPGQPEIMLLSWWQANAVAVGADPAAAGAENRFATGDASALWLVEEIHHVARPETAPGIDGVAYYRVFARGEADDSVVVSESIIARPWGEDVSELAFPPAGPLSEFCASISDEIPCGQLAWRRRR